MKTYDLFIANPEGDMEPVKDWVLLDASITHLPDVPKGTMVTLQGYIRIIRKEDLTDEPG